MRRKLSTIKMKIYCFVVNKNVYVRDAYQLPIDLDKEYHQKHRIREWFRLLNLLLKYRVLHRRPSEEETTVLKEMQKKREQLFNLKDGTVEKEKDDASKLRKAVTEAIDELKEADLIRFSKRTNIIIWGNGSGGNIPLLVKKVNDFCEKTDEKYHFIWLKNKKKTDEKLIFTTFYYPWLLMEESDYSARKCKTLTDEEIRIISRFDFLRQAADAIIRKYPQVDNAYAGLLSYEIYRYFTAVLEYLEPRLVLVWSETAWVSHISRACCEEGNIPYAMLGVDFFQFAYWFSSVDLPKNNMLMRYNNRITGIKEFNQKELQSANDIIERLKIKSPKINNDLNKKFSKVDFLRPLIIVCEQDRINESLSLTYEEILYLSQMCKKNSWNLMYRPFADYDSCRTECSGRLPSNVIVISEFDVQVLIDRCDVFITVDSEWAYFALVNKKPVVLLGHSEIFDQRCCYEAFNMTELGEIVQKAINYGVTVYQYENFLKYFVFFEKDYFYSARTDTDIMYGQPIKNLIAYLKSVMNRTASF